MRAVHCAFDINLNWKGYQFKKDCFIIPRRSQWAHVFLMGVERFLLVFSFRNRSTQTRTQAEQTSPRGSNISLFKTSHREELWNTTHRQPRRVLQEALHVATSGKSWLGSREKIFYLEHPRDAARARCARGIYHPYYYAPARIASDILYLKIVLRFNFETLVRTDTSCEPNNNYCLFNFFMSRKIHARSNNRLIKCGSHPSCHNRRKMCIVFSPL